MDFSTRLKAEMTQGLVKAILDDAGYRVIKLGIEDTLREVVCLNLQSYLNLSLPDSIRSLPDFAVFDKDMKSKWLLEIKYRRQWDFGVFNEIANQVAIFKDVVLVYVNANPDLSNSSFPDTPTPSSYIRGVRLTWDNELCIHRRQKGGQTLIEKISSYCTQSQKDQCYWGFHKLDEIFDGINLKKEQKTLQCAIESLKGILY